jgi:hypothetical protein
VRRQRPDSDRGVLHRGLESGDRANVPSGRLVQCRCQPVACLSLGGDAFVEDGETIQRDLDALVRRRRGYHVAVQTGQERADVCGLRSGAAVRKDAELVPLWVGKYDPPLIALADVGVSST